MVLTCEKRHYRTNETLTAKCPVCGTPNTECVPIKAKWQMSFICSSCGTWFAVHIESLRKAKEGGTSDAD